MITRHFIYIPLITKLLQAVLVDGMRDDHDSAINNTSLFMFVIIFHNYIIMSEGRSRKSGSKYNKLREKYKKTRN